MINDRDAVNLSGLEDRCELKASNGEYSFFDKQGR